MITIGMLSVRSPYLHISHSNSASCTAMRGEQA